MVIPVPVFPAPAPGSGFRRGATRPEVQPGRRLRRLVRFVGAVAGALIGVAVVLLGAGWVLSPSVADAPERVVHDIAPHGARPLSTRESLGRTATALIATEDSRFASNPGLDSHGVLRALSAPILGGSGGGATLEQQLAKRLYTPRDSTRDMVEDAFLALKLARAYSKDEILRMYFSDAYFGQGFYGLDAAARGYFGKAPAQLGWGQASLLAGLVQAPTAYDPLVHLTAARARQRHVLDRLMATGHLTAAQASAAFRQPLRLVRS